MNILVLGGTRFIGRALVEGLLADGHTVALLHTGHHNPFGESVQHLLADRQDYRALRRALRGRQFDIVFEHAYVHPTGTRPEDVEAMLEALKAPPQRVVFTSSAAVYEVGAEVASPIIESSPYATRGDTYSVHKITTEQALLQHHAAGHFEATIIRPSFVIGPYSPGERLGFFWDRLLANRPIVLPDEGETRLQFAYVHDVAAALRCAATHGPAAGQAYNVGWEAAITQRELIAELAEIAGVDATVAPVPRAALFDAGASPFDAPYYFGESLDISGVLGEFHLSTERARRALPIDQTPWRDALKAAYQWYSEGREDRPPMDTEFEDRMLQGARTMALAPRER
ncbi:MAG: NAD-dependent epimerase/dehydratase family protein [Myxococcota bacterium]